MQSKSSVLMHSSKEEGEMTGENTITDDIQNNIEKYKAGMQIIFGRAGAETGQTPKEIIGTKNKAKLYHYEPSIEKRFAVPLLLMYALINRPSVLQLTPGNRRVEHLLNS